MPDVKSTEDSIKVLILSDPNSPHTVKWINALNKKGFSILLFGITNCEVDSYSSLSNFRFESLGMTLTGEELSETKVSKIRYIKAVNMIKKIIKDFRPDVVHAHYATSFGLLGALSGFHPFIVSVWGSDIFEFPLKSIVHKNIIKYVFSKADKIFSTSKVMAGEIQKYTNKNIDITPFGINTGIFKPMDVISPFEKGDMIIGTVKNLRPIYGIDRLINIVHLIKTKWPEFPVKLLIVGGGPQENELKALVKKFNLDKHTIFTGGLDNQEVPKYYNMMSLAVFTSKSESFGVAALEASACGIPVVVSDVPGFRETVVDGKSGIIINAGDLSSVAKTIKNLLENQKQKNEMGGFGRKWVLENFEEEKMINNMIALYEHILDKKTPTTVLS